MRSAISITIPRRVFCKIRASITPLKLTIPVINRSPTEGRSLFTPAPGLIDPSPIVTNPICSIFPRQASIATIKGFVYFLLIKFIF